MARSRLTERDPPAVVTNTATIPQRASRLPRKLRFPILLFLNFCINSSLWSIAENFLSPELGAVSKVEDRDYLVLAHLVYRVAFLYFTWRANYDCTCSEPLASRVTLLTLRQGIDVSALAILTNAPYAYILSTYYEISTLTVANFATIEIISIAFPTLLLRPSSPLHNPKASLRNRFLLESFQVQNSTALLAIGVYVVVLWGAIKSAYLHPFLVTHFSIRTLEDAYNETPVSLAIKVAPAGIAARTFLLNPSIAAQNGAETPVEPFDPATATLPETLRYNFWFFSKRTRTLLRQTGVITAFMLANTIQRTMNLRETDATGAAGYASVWVFATWVTAAWWLWVGDTDN